MRPRRNRAALTARGPCAGGHAAAALIVTVAVTAAGCGGDHGSTPPATRSASPSAAPAVAPRAGSIGQPCGLETGRACGARLTCVRSPGGEAVCLALPVGVVCGSFQCAATDACCDPQRSECTPPGHECAPRAEAGSRGAICRENGCDPGLRCAIGGPAERPAPFGVCVDR